MELVQSQAGARPQLKRALGRRDLVLLFIVAIVNLNVVPSIAANGGVTIWLWILALVFFFWPQGIAVIELAQRYPGEGGVYLWIKNYFGDFHGFLAGWCYWTNNVFYIPTVLLYLVGVATFAAGPRAKALGENPEFTLFAALTALVILVALSVMGQGIGKWVNNVGGIGTWLIAAILIVLGAVVFATHGSALKSSDFRVQGTDWRIIATFGTICFSLVGLELGSVMGDEIKDPRRTVPQAVVIGGIASGILYIGATLTLLLAVPKENIGVLQGVVQAIQGMAKQVGMDWIVAPLAVVLSVSIAGIASAWLSGSARIPFVAGMDRYLPESLGRLHPRTATPYVALIAQGVLSAIFMVFNNLVGRPTVKEAFEIMLALAVVLQLVPFLYLYATLIRIAKGTRDANGRFGAKTLMMAGLSGLITTAIGMVVAFVPPSGVKSVWVFEIKMILGTLFFLGLAGFFFYVYSRRKQARSVVVSV